MPRSARRSFQAGWNMAGGKRWRIDRSESGAVMHRRRQKHRRQTGRCAVAGDAGIADGRSVMRRRRFIFHAHVHAHAHAHAMCGCNRCNRCSGCRRHGGHPGRTTIMKRRQHRRKSLQGQGYRQQREQQHCERKRGRKDDKAAHAASLADWIFRLIASRSWIGQKMARVRNSCPGRPKLDQRASIRSMHAVRQTRTRMR